MNNIGFDIKKRVNETIKKINDLTILSLPFNFHYYTVKN